MVYIDTLKTEYPPRSIVSLYRQIESQSTLKQRIEQQTPSLGNSKAIEGIRGQLNWEKKYRPLEVHIAPTKVSRSPSIETVCRPEMSRRPRSHFGRIENEVADMVNLKANHTLGGELKPGSLCWQIVAKEPLKNELNATDSTNLVVVDSNALEGELKVRKSM